MRDEYNCEYPDIAHTASNTDLTGLMYRPPVNMDEYESYQEVYGMEIPEISPSDPLQKCFR